MCNLLTQNIRQVKQRIAVAEKDSKRISGIVQLMAVSKTRSANEIRKAHMQGIIHFGENYLQEALPKQEQLADLPIIWHFIGPIQSNKTADISRCFDWVHGVDRIKIARRLNDQRGEELPPLNICIQINISGEVTKSGVKITDTLELAESVSLLRKLKLRGLMVIPAPNQSLDLLSRQYEQTKGLLLDLNKAGFTLDTLSMGMSNDLECAVAAGSTMVRVGTAVFGPRN